MPHGYIGLAIKYRTTTALGGLFTICLSLVACDNDGYSKPTAPDAARASLKEARKQLDEKFVVFSQSFLHIDVPGTITAVPVLVGSQPSQETLLSTDPETVSVTQDGRLYAHRSGMARIEAKGSSARLLVMVGSPGPTPKPIEGAKIDTRPPASGRVSIRPMRARARIGEFLKFEVYSGAKLDRLPLVSSAERLLEPLGENVFQARAPGLVRVCGVLSPSGPCAIVEVTK